MEIERFELGKPEYPFSPAVRVGGLVFTAGAGVFEPGDDIEVQTTKTIEYLADVLRQCGTDLDHVVKGSVFLADIGEWDRFNQVWCQYFPKNKPVRTTVQVGRFSGAMRIEIDFVAAVPDDTP